MPRAGVAPAGRAQMCQMQIADRLDSTLLTARRQRTGTITGEDTSPHPHNPSRPLRSQHGMHTTKRPSQAPLRLDTHAGWSGTDVKNMRDAKAHQHKAYKRSQRIICLLGARLARTPTLRWKLLNPGRSSAHLRLSPHTRATDRGQSAANPHPHSQSTARRQSTAEPPAMPTPPRR